MKTILLGLYKLILVFIVFIPLAFFSLFELLAESGDIEKTSLYQFIDKAFK